MSTIAESAALAAAVTAAQRPEKKAPVPAKTGKPMSFFTVGVMTSLFVPVFAVMAIAAVLALMFASRRNWCDMHRCISVLAGSTITWIVLVTVLTVLEAA